MSRPKPYTLAGEPDAQMVDALEEMLNTLFQDVELGGAHALLGSIVTDVVASSPSRGALIVGNSTPAWTVLPIGAASFYLRSDGSDPSWVAITEPDIVNGALLARLGDNETITGAWRFNTAPFTANAVAWSTRNAADSVTVPLIRLQSTAVIIGDNATNNNSFVSLGAGGATRVEMSSAAMYSITSDQVTLGDSGRIWKEIWVNDCFLSQSIQLSGLISPAALGAGNNNNYNPTSLADAFALRLTGNATTSVITGITAPADGRLLFLINIGTPTWNITNEDTNSTDVNRVLTATGRTRAIETGGTISLWYDTTSNRWREWGGTTNFDDTLTAVKTADESVNNSVALQDDDHLFVSVVAGGTYRFDLILFGTQVSAVPGLQLTMAGTAAATSIKYEVIVHDDTSGLFAAYARSAALGTAVAAATMGANDFYAEIHGTIVVSTAGTLRLQFAQNTASANNTTLQQHSSMTVKRII